jgi:hypothetical protein
MYEAEVQSLDELNKHDDDSAVNLVELRGDDWVLHIC